MIARLACIAVVTLVCTIPALCGPIHDAAAKGNVAQVATLLEAHPDLVSSVDKIGNTPLHFAARHNQVEVARLLLANGADVNAKSLRSSLGPGRRPLHEALLSYNHKEMVELLLSKGADANGADDYGATPLHYAARADLKSDAELLLANGAEVNARDRSSGTPLHWAVAAHYLDMVELLVAHNADIDAIGYTACSVGRPGCTPLGMALSQERASQQAALTDNTRMIAFLRSHGAHDCSMPGCPADKK